MLRIDDTIISLDLIEKKFVCDVSKCKGVCCVAGDSGAPLEPEEAEALDHEYPQIQVYLRPSAREAIEAQGRHIIDSDGDLVTPLVDGKECAYVVFEDGIARCGIEKAYLEGRSSLRKPISCYLYPVRIKKFSQYQAVNYDIWEICADARRQGERLGTPVYSFLEKPLTERFGEAWYKELKLVAENYKP